MGYNSWAKFSFLPKNPALSGEYFREHYLEVHGPLAASLVGFRKFTMRYEQNHVIEKLNDYRISADGVTKTWQLERSDYSIGFFNEPDYFDVQADEKFLLDHERVISVLADAQSDWVAPETGQDSTKILAVVYSETTMNKLNDLLESHGARGVTLSKIEPSLSSALGYCAISFDGKWVIEAWFSTDLAARAAGTRLTELNESRLDLWLVQNHIIYERPEDWTK